MKVTASILTIATLSREIILLLSFLVALGLIGTAELGGSMYGLLWLIPIAAIDAMIIKEIEYENN